MTAPGLAYYKDQHFGGAAVHLATAQRLGNVDISVRMCLALALRLGGTADAGEAVRELEVAMVQSDCASTVRISLGT
jgi:hypothetical protein